MKKNLMLMLLGLGLILTGSFQLNAQETGHYVPGIMGLKAGSVPPPGFYYLMHNVFYTSDSYYDGAGNKAGIGFDLNVFANIHRFVYVWEDVLLGADYGVHAIIPTTYTNIQIDAFDVDDKKYGIGDIVMEPLLLSWHKTKYDAAFGLAAVVPTGSYDITKPASPGKSFWTALLTLGGTYYLTEDKSWHAAILSRYEVHSKKKDFDITPGNDFTFEWGIGKTIPAKQVWSFGVSGYAHWQLSEDKGDDVLYDPSVKDRVFAIGPEVGCIFPKAKLIFELRGQAEFGAIDRSQGPKACLSIFKAF